MHVASFCDDLLCQKLSKQLHLDTNWMARELGSAQLCLLWSARRHLIHTLGSAKGNSTHPFWILVPQLFLAAPEISGENTDNCTDDSERSDPGELPLELAHLLLWFLELNIPREHSNIFSESKSSSSGVSVESDLCEIPVYILWALLWPASERTKQREVVRRLALACLALHDDVIIVKLLPQLLRLVCLQSSIDTPLARLLLLRALRSPVYVGHHFLWRLRALRTGSAAACDDVYLVQMQVPY